MRGSMSLIGATAQAVSDGLHMIIGGPAIPRDASYGTPFSAAKPLALAIASAMLTVPELTGLILLRSKLPELLGWGRP